MTLRNVGLVLLAGVCVMTLSCGTRGTGGTSTAAKRPKVAFVTNNPEEFWTIVEAGCRKAEAETGVEVIFRRPSQGDSAVQKEIIDTLINQGVEAIAVSVIDPVNQTDYLNEIASKVKLLAVDNDAPNSKRLAYIGTDNYSAGRAVGKLIKEVMPEGGVIAMFVGQMEALNARQRRQGVIDEIAGRPAPPDPNNFTPSPDGEVHGKYRFHNRTYLDQPEGAGRAKENAVNCLTELADEPNVCMVGLWAYNPPAILSALRDRNKVGKVKVVAFDEMEATLDGIRDGEIYATVVQQPFLFGYQSVKTMAELVRNPDAARTLNPQQYVPYRIIMKEAGPAKDGEPPREAVEEFRQELRRLTGKG
ncbi:MAG: sugar-binding protein [Gemmatales bacterium]|nr:sugar-binding protein [Gemmatales bacterium]MDW8387111.1 sugar-binding protein [Gemmatales bacterium]